MIKKVTRETPDSPQEFFFSSVLFRSKEDGVPSIFRILILVHLIGIGLTCNIVFGS